MEHKQKCLSHHRWHKLLTVFLIVMMLVMGRGDASADVSLPSWAGQATSTAAGLFGIPGFVAFCPIGGMLLSGLKATAAQEVFGSQSGATGVFMYLMPCLGDLIKDTADDFIADFYPEIAQIFYYFLTIAIIIFGFAMVSGGLENFKRDAMTFVLKITAVVALTNNMSLILESMFDIQDGLILAATGYVSTGSFLTGFSKLHCSMSLDIWMRADCLINLIIGVRVPAVSADIVSSVYNGADYTTVANSMLQSGGNLDDGLLAFFWNCLMSGSVLTLAALIGMYMVFNLILGLLKAANIYLMSMMGMAFMAIMGGILLPLMIMRSTYEYFDNWAKNFLSVMLQPIVLFAFLNVAFTAFDVILVSGKSSLLHVVAGNAVDNTEGGFTMNKYLASTGAVVREDMGCYNADLNHSAYSKDQQVVAVRDYGAEIRQPIEPVPQAKAIVEGDRPNDPRDFKVCIPSKVIDPLVLAARRDPPVVLQQGNDSEEQFIMELAGAFVMAWLTSYVFVMMLDMIPGLAKKLSGGGSGAALA